MKLNNHSVKGQEAEEKASMYLLQNGYTILERNFHSRFGEIDIIALKENTLHIFEVKYSEKYDAISRITPSKLQKIIKTIDYYLLTHGFSYDYQIDAIIMSSNKIEMIKNISY